MICKLVFIAASVLAVTHLTKAATPPFIRKCQSDDFDCARDSTQKIIPIFAAGLPEYGVEQLDPVVFKTIDAGLPNLKFMLHNITLTGLKNCEAKKIHRDSKLLMTFLCNTNLVGEYELKGRVLILSVNGKGKINVSLRKALINVELDLDEKEGDDGKTHWYIKSWQYSLDTKEKPEIMFENLFKGNEVLGRTARELISNSGNNIIKEIGAPVFKTVLLRVIKNINKFFKTIPVEDLSID